MTAVDTSLADAELTTVIEVVRDLVSPPSFLTAYLLRREEQLQNEERLCEEVMQIPVTDEEVESIREELARSIDEILESPMGKRIHALVYDVTEGSAERRRMRKTDSMDGSRPRNGPCVRRVSPHTQGI